MENLNRVKVHIAGCDYVLNSVETNEYVLSLAEQLDRQIKELMDANDTLSITTAGILCAISYLDDYKKAEQNADNLRTQIRDYLQDAAKARIEADEAKREAERLRRELQMKNK